MKLDFDQCKWINRPEHYQVSENRISLTTSPHTDFWQRTFYGFRNDNAPALLFSQNENFSLTTRVSFAYRNLFDQCGLVIYLDSENWFKASIEYENSSFARLGSVVTNFGFSDWATTDIPLPTEIWYRLSRRHADFLIEYSLDGNEFKQMRIFRLHSLPEGSEAEFSGKVSLFSKQAIDVGFYACSPADSRFEARFSDIQFGPSIWSAHGDESA
ncbi:MAG: DUF1349 domain-containing protein [Aliiglaciecola sp.]